MSDSPQSHYEKYFKWSKYYGSSMDKGFYDFNDSRTKFSALISNRRTMFCDESVYKREFNYNTISKEWEALGSKPSRNPITLLLNRIRRLFSR